jgi:hypothetical protein
MFDESIIGEDLIYPDDDGFSSVRCKIRLPWYRGLPVSCVRDIDVTIDGTVLDRNDLYLTLHGIDHSLDEALRLDKVFWFVRYVADLHFRTPKPLNPGPHDLNVVMHLSIPYVREMPFLQVAECKKRVTLVSRDL